MDYKIVVRNILITIGLLAGYVLLRIHVASYMPFFTNYPDGILVPYGTLICLLGSYIVSGNIFNALKLGAIAITTLTPLVVLYNTFPEYQRLFHLILMVFVWINMIYQNYYKK